MTYSKRLFVFFVTLVLVACHPKKQMVSTQDDGIIDFVILQINDVYELSPLEGGKSGGMARVEYIHKQLLADNPNTLLVHGGDFLNPSLMGTLKQNGERLRGKQMIEMMNSMHFDLVAIGNHEFDLPYNDLQKRLDESNFQWIGTNIKHVIGDKKEYFYTLRNGVKKDIPRYKVFAMTDADGTHFDLGFISATINSNPKDYVDYGDLYEDATLAYQQVKEKSDLVLGLTHLKIAQDKLLSASLPDIPLIMGGHEHEHSRDRVGDAYITKADANAKSVYIHRIRYNKNTGQATIKSELKMIDETIQSDPEALAIADKWARFQQDKIAEVADNPQEVIYHSDVHLDGRDTPIRSRQTNLGVLFAEAMAKAYGVQAAFVNGGSIRFDDQLVGDIVGVDIFRALPYGGAILKIEIKGDLLIKVLQEGELRAGTGAYLQRYNLSKTDAWRIGDQKIDPDKLYTVAISDYLIRGLDIPILKEDNPGITSVYRPSGDELSVDIRVAIIDFMKKKQGR